MSSFISITCLLKIETRADDFYLCYQLQQCRVMLYLTSECVVKSYEQKNYFSSENKFQILKSEFS